MSKDSNSSRPMYRRTPQSANENEFESSRNQISKIPSRAPLNSITDPSQYQSKSPSEQLKYDFREKPVSSKDSSSKKQEEVTETQPTSSVLKTPKVYGRGKSTNSELNSAQSTPLRSGPGISIAGAASGFTLARLPSQLGNCAGRGSVFPRVSRGISTAIPQQLLDEVPQFELDDDPSFWNDHNVQVLIRIRPFSNAEMISQGYGRCLRQESAQTVVWQGHPETRFTFDHIACESISQEKLFIVAGLPMVDNCMSGYNSCMFAYGQTGSGKTYTMMGEIDKMDGNLSDDSGITPRIFEYLFTRISQEKESRKHERLTYSCKCSFLEIYNEQITDLLEPSSTNLQLREDSKKGVYVENLTEHSVRTVNDVLKLLQQGAANRKIAATHMNSESSRSHSVFTCVVESRWEKDSIAHLRFGRLNLVDLAGSERQKSSGAEGDRLKEAANINKSLSTLGMVIMSLVDLAQGKHRHVPYRDSRLTFLLQDSLGGNSKTTIIANVSPSTCSANETLSTLKFAQRAKLIQNNAKINEDASSGVIALQQQIQQLKDQLSYLMKHQNTPMKLIDLVPRLERSNLGYFSNRCEPSERTNMYECRTIEGGIVEEKHIKAALRGALRREKVAEIEVSRMKAEIEHLDHLTHQREEEVQRTKMMLRFREEKIKRLELLLGGLISADKFHMDENNNLREENLLLQAKIERNPEVTRFALENIRLLEQIRLLQDFYEQGERETLLAEISELRNQVLESLEDDKNSSDHQFSPTKLDQMQEPQDVEERERCMDLNSKLIREVDELRRQLANGMNSTQDTSSSINNVFLGSDSVDEVTSSNVPVDEVIYGKNEDKKEYILDWQRDNVHKQLKDAESLIETMKLEQSQLIRELESVQTENQRLMKMLDSDEVTERELDVQHENYKRKQYGLVNQDRNVRIEGSEGISILTLQAKLEKLSTDLKEAQILNGQYIEDHVTRLSQDHQTEVVRCEVEMETTRTIIHLQEEIDRLSMEFQVSLCSMAEENLNLRKHVAAKEDELRVSCAEWERATLDLTTFLIDGSRSLLEASTQVKSISTSFPNVNDWISEHVERAANICLEREETMLQLQKSLEDAQNTLLQMDHKLYSLKGAALALTEHQQLETSSSQEESIDELKVSRESLQFFSDTITSYLPITLENQPQILQQIRYELGEVNKRFRSMSACFSKVMNMNHHPDCRKDFTVAEGWTTDCSSSCSYSSVESVDNDDKPSSSDNYKCTSTRNEQPMVLNSDEGSNSEGAVLLIRKEARKAYESFVKLNDQLMAFPFGKKNQNCMEEVLSSSDLHASEKLNELCGDGHDQPTSTRAGAGTNNFGELDGKEKHSSAGSFFAKFEEAYGTIKEADCMLKAMVKANENANTLTAIWKQAGEELMADKESLTEEIKQLKSHVLSRDEEKEMLQDGIQFSLREKASILSFLEECFLAMQTSVEELFETARSHAIQAVEETQTFFCGLRSSSEDLMCKAIQNDIGIFVLHCQMSEYSQKFRRLNRISNSDKSSIQEHCPVADNLELSLVSRDDNSALHPEKCEDNGFEIPCMSRKETNEFDLVDSDSVDKSSELKRELERKDVLLKGLLFDFSLLQEFASHRKDIKNELEKLMIAMSQVQHELKSKIVELDEVLVQNTELEGRLSDAMQALSNSNTELEHANGALDILSQQNIELKNLLKDIYLKNSEAEQLVEDQREAIESLEREIIRVSSSQEKQLVPSVEDIEDALGEGTSERDQLLEKLTSLQDKLDIVSALADENQAIAAEARQDSEASKMYAEQKEEEVKILEHSIEELESTINVLEKKVHEMDEEVEKQRLIRDSLELELQALRHRLLTVEDLTESMSSENSNTEDQLSRKLHRRSLEINEAHSKIRFLEKEKAKQANEIRQLKDYISELVLHAEAQALQYQQKYKTLEAMLHEVKTDLSVVSAAPTSERADKTSARTRGSSSPFRCIAGLVQQMNQEKDQELSSARLHIEELEALAASRYKEVCMLNTRLATAESMTHDVIRDLLSVKLDISNYANIIDQHQLQRLLEEAQHHRQQFVAMEHEIGNLRSQIDDLLEERERCISEINRNNADQLDTQILVEQLQERDQLLIAQNDMLKMDKSNLQKRVAELDEMVKKLFSTQNQQSTNSMSRPCNYNLGERLAHSQKVLSRINDQLAQNRGPEGSGQNNKLDRRGNETKFRKHMP